MNPVFVPILAIDTSGPITFCSVRDDKGSFFSETRTRNQADEPNSESISEVISSVLKRANLESKDLKALVYGEGPGSFTGLRIGLSFLKGISFAHKIPLIGISSLKAFAYEFKGESSLIVALANAQREELFCSVFSTNLSKEFLAPTIVPSSELENQLEKLIAENNLQPNSVIHVGFPEMELQNCNVLSPQHCAESLLSLASEGAVPEFVMKDLVELEPLYLRAVNARTIAERGRGLLLK